MSLGDLGIDRNAPPLQFDSDPLPKGKYRGEFTKAEVTEASTGAQVIKLEATFEGGRKAWTTLTLIKSSGEQNMPGIGLLSSAAAAVGLDEIPVDEADLLHKPLTIKLDIEVAQGQYAAKNVMKAFYPLESKGKEQIQKKIADGTKPSEPEAQEDFDIPF